MTIRTLVAWALACMLSVSGCTQSPQDATKGPIPADAHQNDLALDQLPLDTATSPDLPTDAGTIFDPEPGATALTPDHGPTSGLQVVTITGESLAAVTAVHFGDSPALQVDVIDDMTLQVVTPPHAVGTVDVTLHVPSPPGQPEVPDQVIHDGYRYQGTVALTKVTPNQGPAEGGTAVTVTGHGFSPQTQFVVGHRLALLPSVLDEQTATFLTPPGEGGSVAVTAIQEDGSAQLPHAFTYHQAPHLQSVTPAVMGWMASGGQALDLQGSGLTGQVLTVTLHGVGQKDTAQDIVGQVITAWPGLLKVKLGPAAAPGIYDVTVSHADGASTLPASVALVQLPTNKPETLSWSLLTVSPAAQPVNQLAPVSVGVSGYATMIEWAQEQKKPSTVVTFGGVVGKVLAVSPNPDGSGATLQVQPPAPLDPGQTPQSVTVGVELFKHAVQKPLAFTYLPAVPEILSINPISLDPAAGTPLTVTWGPRTPASPAVVGVRVGALQASQVMASAGNPGEGLVTAKAPPGAPGWADVTLTFADGTSATRKSGVHYTGAERRLVAVLPALGAQAGGTQVDVVGEGLDGMSAVWFGNQAAKNVVVHDSGWATVTTPRGNPGPVGVTGKWSATPQIPASQYTLANGFVYFDPISSVGGTWGAGIEGTLNVTVVSKSDSQTPIAGALVVAQSPMAMFQGLTDDRGQITFSAQGMVPPVHVHASKAGYTAGSLIALSTENATIRLSKTASGSGSNNDPVPPNGTITGTVLDAEKYTVLPEGTCVGQPSVGGNCMPCTSSVACPLGGTCELIGLSGATTITDGGFCAGPCASPADCPDGWTCGQFGTGLDARMRCKPTVGKPQIRCSTASGSIFGGIPTWPESIIGPDQKFSISATPGGAAIVCWSGYVDKHTGVFVPLALGLTRHLFTFPGQQVGGVEVHVRVPLDRELRVHMLALPVGPDTTGGQRSITAGIDLGSDGYIPLGATMTKQTTDTLVLTAQPNHVLFAPPNDDLRYEFYGGLSNAYNGPPQSTAAAPGRNVVGLDRAAVWSPGNAHPSVAKVAPGALHAFAAAGDTRVAVGEGGRIATWTGGDYTTQASPTAKTLRAVWLATDAAAGAGLDGWAAGDGGVLVRRSTLGWTVWPNGLGEAVVALDGRGADDVWALHPTGALRRTTGDANGATVWTIGAKAPPLGSGLAYRALVLLPLDRVLVAGDQGQLWLAQPAGLPGTYFWTALASGTTATIRAVTRADDGQVWLAGDRGYLARWDGTAVIPVSSGSARNFLGMRPDGGSMHVVGGQGAWLRILPNGKVEDHSLADTPVDFRGLLPTFDGGLVAAGEPVVEMGPYLEMPYLTEPVPSSKLGNKLAWMAAPGHTPTLNLIRLADSSYSTRWEIFLHGATTSVELPDFVALGQFNPLPPGTLFMRHWRILAPQLDIDHLNPKLLSQYSWTSWAYNTSALLSPTPDPGPFNPTLPPPEVPPEWPYPK